MKNLVMGLAELGATVIIIMGLLRFKSAATSEGGVASNFIIGETRTLVTAGLSSPNQSSHG